MYPLHLDQTERSHAETFAARENSDAAAAEFTPKLSQSPQSYIFTASMFRNNSAQVMALCRRRRIYNTGELQVQEVTNVFEKKHTFPFNSRPRMLPALFVKYGTTPFTSGSACYLQYA